MFSKAASDPSKKTDYLELSGVWPIKASSSDVEAKDRKQPLILELTDVKLRTTNDFENFQHISIKAYQHINF